MGKIEWCDQQWNPLAGCTMVSPGCTNCYAMKMAHRFKGVHPKYEGTTRVTDGGKVIWTGHINLDEKALMEPLTWKKPRRVFVNSMSDLFHESVPFGFIDKVFAVMALTPDITYMVLTKRPERMAEYFNHPFIPALDGWKKAAKSFPKISQWKSETVWDYMPQVLPNVWLGTTVENQEQADKRLPYFLEFGAAVRFISCEPLLGPVDLLKQYPVGKGSIPYGALVDWVIAGGESGHGARPVHPDWIRSLRDQCQEAGVPFFFKQWGEWLPTNRALSSSEIAVLPDVWDESTGKCLELQDGSTYVKVGKKAAGRILDGIEWNEFPMVGGSEGGNA